MGPLVDRMAIHLTPGLRGTGGTLPAGAQLPVRRADLTLLYTVADDDATRVILDHPAARENPDEHQRAGINLASAALATAARSGDPNLAMPGLTALLVAEKSAGHRLCRALLALPPAAVMAEAASAGVDSPAGPRGHSRRYQDQRHRH